MSWYNLFVLIVYLLLVDIDNWLLTRAVRGFIGQEALDPAIPLPGPLRWTVLLISFAAPLLLAKIMILTRSLT